MSRSPQSSRPGRTNDERGSVLIFVVGVLLLLAIIATAFLGTSRADRTSTQQNANNTQIDLLLEGVINGMRGAILADARFQTGSNGTDSLVGDTFLAARVPVTPLPNAVPALGANPPMWTSITAPILDSVFSSPFAQSAFVATTPVTPATFGVRDYVMPTTITLKNGETILGFRLNANKVAGTYPDTAGYVQSPYVVPAADTDGDGVADAGLVKVPVGTIAGVTYYYAARIVDLGSAINVNSAWMWNDPSIAYGAPAYRLDANFSPSNLDLLGLLAGTAASQQQTQMDALNQERFGDTGAATVNLIPVNDNNLNRPDFQFAGSTANSTDALWNQLGRRPGNPGYNAIGTKYKPFGLKDSVALATKYVLRPTTLTDLDTAMTQSLSAMSPVNPYTSTAGSEITWFANNFYFPQNNATPNKPLRAFLTATNGSGADDVTSVAPTLPGGGKVQALVANTRYDFGDVVSVNLGSGVTRNYVCLRDVTTSNTANFATTGNGPLAATGRQYWGLLSWSNQSQKIPANTADFGEMWWGFRRLMAASVANDVNHQRLSFAPFPTNTDGSNDNSPNYYYDNMSGVNGPAYSTTAKARQFRNPIRDSQVPNQFDSPPPSARVMNPSEVLQLRTAIAAVNAIDLRDGDSKITGRKIRLYDFSVTPPVATYDVTVFGTEMQPYITEVYVNNNTMAGQNPNGYVAIELYNPYSVPLILNNWALGMINRGDATAYPRAVTPVIDLTHGSLQNNRFEPNAGDYLVIPANGFVILENFSVTGLVTDARARPMEVGNNFLTAIDMNTVSPATPPAAPTPAIADGSIYYKYIPGLSQVLQNYNGVAAPGKELVLLRPRDWSPNGVSTLRTASTVVENAEDPALELGAASAAAVNLGDWVPVDSFDFYGIYRAPAAPPDFQYWNYRRDGAAWKWTHGGDIYASTAVAPATRQPGTIAVSYPVANTPPVPLLGTLAGQASSFPDTWLGTQINNEGWPSINESGSTFNAANPALNNRTPFGAFAQETDLFRIPYIGAYTVRTVGSTDVAAGTFDTSFTEMNTLPMDFMFAHDQDEGDLPIPTPPATATNNAFEQVGRFIPLSTISPFLYRNWDSAGTLWTGATLSPPDWYDFSYFATPRVRRTLTDLFTAHSPLDDGLPNVGADTYSASTALDADTNPMAVNNVSTTVAPGLSVATVAGYSNPTVTASTNLNSQTPDMYRGAWLEVTTGPARGEVRQITGAAVNGSTPPAVELTLASNIAGLATGAQFRVLGTPEDAVPTHGLVNINTAPWQVIARLPLAFNANGTVNRNDSEAIAKRIVAYRDGDPASGQANLRRPRGPFKSLLDLNKVLSEAASADTAPGSDQMEYAFFQTAGGNLTTSLTTFDNPGYQYGDPSLDAVAGDFEERLLALSRISNLITTRSDAFVAYIVLQGWRDAGTAQAKMVSQRRAAFIIDRSGASVANPSLTSTKVPTN